MKILTLVVLITISIFTSSAQANCYVIGELKGYITREGSNYEISEDAISNQKFIVEINGDNSGVTPSDMSCYQAGLNSLVCMDSKSESELVVETWFIFPNKGKSVYTKTTNGYGSFNGGTLMVGNIKGSCD